MFRKIQANAIEKSCFDLIGKDWALITACKQDGSVNSMTISWGGMGVMWNKPVAFVFVRPQRYTKEFIDESKALSICFFDDEYRSMLSYMGKTSGKNVDKIKEQNLAVDYIDGVPYIANANLVLSGKVLAVKELEEGDFLDKSMVNTFYPSNDFHTMYIVGLDNILEK